MKTIHKVQLNFNCIQTFTINSLTFKPLCIMMQDGLPCLWYETVTPVIGVTDLTVKMFGTGWDAEASAGMDYLGSVIDGGFVWHFYGSTSSVRD